MYGFGVGDPMPVIAIPLAEDDRFTLDFGKVYHQTFESLSAFSRRVDYEREPERMDTYADSDRARIREVMRAATAS